MPGASWSSPEMPPSLSKICWSSVRDAGSAHRRPSTASTEGGGPSWAARDLSAAASAASATRSTSASSASLKLTALTIPSASLYVSTPRVLSATTAPLSSSLLATSRSPVVVVLGVIWRDGAAREHGDPRGIDLLRHVLHLQRARCAHERLDGAR